MIAESKKIYEKYLELKNKHAKILEERENIVKDADNVCRQKLEELKKERNESILNKKTKIENLSGLFYTDSICAYCNNSIWHEYISAYSQDGIPGTTYSTSKVLKCIKNLKSDSCKRFSLAKKMKEYD